MIVLMTTLLWAFLYNLTFAQIEEVQKVSCSDANYKNYFKDNNCEICWYYPNRSYVGEIATYYDFWEWNKWQERLINPNNNIGSIISFSPWYNILTWELHWSSNFIPANFDTTSAPFKPVLWYVKNVWIATNQDVSKLNYNKPTFLIKWKITNYISAWNNSDGVIPSNWWWKYKELKFDSNGDPYLQTYYASENVKKEVWNKATHTECYLVYPAWCWDWVTDSSYGEQCDNGTDNWNGIGDPTSKIKNWVVCNTSCKIVQPTCGSAAKPYSASDTSYGSDTFCWKSYETVVPANPAFPSKWWSSSWTCKLWNQTVNCSASRANDITPPPGWWGWWWWWWWWW